MPVGAIIGGVASIGGALLGASSQKKAAKQANESQQAATQAQLQLGRETMALNKDIYNSNYGVLSPYASRGNVAGESLNALLGLPQAPVMRSPLAAPQGGVQTNPAYSQQAIGGNQDVGIQPNQTGPNSAVSRFLQRHPQFGNQTGVPLPGQPTPTVPSQPAGTPTTTPTAPAITPQSAFQNFANSAGMNFQLEQGANALNNLYAARGMLQSGAAAKGLQDYGQQTALNNYFLPYMGLLGNQQATGAGAASSIAGVGSAFGNTAANINAGMGANIQSGANAASNAALLRGQANSNMWGGIASGLGGLASSFAPKPGF